jgi:hypothetical protein
MAFWILWYADQTLFYGLQIIKKSFIMLCVLRARASAGYSRRPFRCTAYPEGGGSFETCYRFDTAVRRRKGKLLDASRLHEGC